MLLLNGHNKINKLLIINMCFCLILIIQSAGQFVSTGARPKTLVEPVELRCIIYVRTFWFSIRYTTQNASVACSRPPCARPSHTFCFQSIWLLPLLFLYKGINMMLRFGFFAYLGIYMGLLFLYVSPTAATGTCETKAVNRLLVKPSFGADRPSGKPSTTN